MRTPRLSPYLLLAGLVTAPAVAQELPADVGARRIQVDCDAGGSLRAALREPGEELLIEIRGFCAEAAEIRRDRVTLRGGDPRRDGIRPPADADPEQAALLVRGARRIRVENLGFAGAALAGLRVIDTHGTVALQDCRFENNGAWGVAVNDAMVTLERAILVANGGGAGSGVRGGLLAARGSAVSCLDCRIESNPAAGENVGVVAFSHSTVSLRGGSVEGSTAALAQLYSSITTTDTDLTGGEWAFQANFYGELFVSGGELSGGFLAATQSNVNLFGVTQTLNPNQNFVTEGSMLVADDRSVGDGIAAATTLDGLTLVSDFSAGKLVDGTVLGQLNCSIESRVFCDGTEVKLSSNCGRCP